jgi:hypothetical protein
MYPFGYNLGLILNKSAGFFRENLREKEKNPPNPLVKGESHLFGHLESN